jgi:RNA polymerase primary sigma factor
MEKKRKSPTRRNPERHYGHNEMSLEEIAKVLWISRERVRQIEMQAIRKIRSPLVSRRLRDYLEE